MYKDTLKGTEDKCAKFIRYLGNNTKTHCSPKDNGLKEIRFFRDDDKCSGKSWTLARKDGEEDSCVHREDVRGEEGDLLISDEDCNTGWKRVKAGYM